MEGEYRRRTGRSRRHGDADGGHGAYGAAAAYAAGPSGERDSDEAVVGYRATGRHGTDDRVVEDRGSWNRASGRNDDPDAADSAGGRAATRRGPHSPRPEDPVSAARETCLRLLTVRSRSRAELATALTRRGHDAEVIEMVLGRLSEVGLVDDAAFAEAFVASRQGARSLARTALSHRLRQRGVDREIVDQAVSAITMDDELEAARALADRKVAATRGLPKPARARRIASALARRGYPAAVAAQVVREVLAIDEEIEFEEGDPIETE